MVRLQLKYIGYSWSTCMVRLQLKYIDRGTVHGKITIKVHWVEVKYMVRLQLKYIGRGLNGWKRTLQRRCQRAMIQGSRTAHFSPVIRGEWEIVRRCAAGVPTHVHQRKKWTPSNYRSAIHPHKSIRNTLDVLKKLRKVGHLRMENSTQLCKGILSVWRNICNKTKIKLCQLI